MSTQVAGVLIDPFERPLANTVIDIRTINNNFALLPGPTVAVQTNAQGEYNFILEPASYAISVQLDGRSVYQGAITVTSTTAPGTLPELLKQAQMEGELPLNYAEYFQQVQTSVKSDADRAENAAASIGDELDRAEQAANASQQSAESSEQSNQQSQEAAQAAQAIADKFTNLDEAVTQTQQNRDASAASASSSQQSNAQSQDAAQRAETAATNAGNAISRSVRAPESETLSALPSAAGRANTFAAFDAQGQSIVKALSSIAQLDSSGKVPLANIPAAAITEVFPVASQSEMLALDAQPGDVAIINNTTTPTQNGSFILMSSPASTLSNWKVLTNDVLVQLGASGGATKVSVQKSSPATSVRTVADALRDSLNVRDFGAKCDGVTDDTSAFIAAVSSGSPVVIRYGDNCLIAPSSTVPSGYLTIEGTITVNSTATFLSTIRVTSGNIVVNSGFSAKFSGSFVAPIRQIFSGSGTVNGIRYVYAEWWGAVADKSIDCAPALNAAMNCLANSAALVGAYRPTIELMSGNYLIKSTWTIPLSANVGLEVKGQGVVFAGTRIVASANFTGDKAVYIPALSDSTQKIWDFKLSDFGIVPQTAGSGPTYGLHIGTDNLDISGLRESHTQNLFIENFAIGMRIVNGRLMKFSRVGIWNQTYPSASSCIVIDAVGKFCGDLSFENCQTVNQQAITGSHGVTIKSTGAYSSSNGVANQVAGIRFSECILYPSDETVFILASGGAHVEDMFFHNCQWDGDSNSMINVNADGVGSQINDLQIRNNFMYGGNKSTSKSQIQIIASNSGFLSNIRVQGNTLGAGINRAINVATTSSGNMAGVFILDNNIMNFSNASNAAIEIGSAVTRVMICNNMALRNASITYPYLIQINSGSNYYVITGNMGAGVVTTSTVLETGQGANRVVANNL